jgi:hypothetical protein
MCPYVYTRVRSVLSRRTKIQSPETLEVSVIKETRGISMNEGQCGWQRETQGGDRQCAS